MGESDHLHYPAQDTTTSSAIWCIRFTDDPGMWRTGDPAAVAVPDMGGSQIVFADCDEILADAYTVDVFREGRYERITVPAPATTAAPDSRVAEASDESDFVTVGEWVRHQRRWLQTGDKLVGQLSRANMLAQVRALLGKLQRQFTSETTWLRKNADSFESDSCLDMDRRDWTTRVKQAQKHLSKAITALKRTNVSALRSSLRQYGRAYTKIEQIHDVGRCETLG